MKTEPSAFKLEQETTITFNAAEDEALIWSASPLFQRKMARKGVVPLDTSSRDHGESHRYRIPKAWIHVVPRKPKVLTEEQRKAMADRARATFGKR